MAGEHRDTLSPAELQEILGYLNFSSGTSDPQFLRNLNGLLGGLEHSLGHEAEPLGEAARLLGVRLDELAGSSAAFQDAEQVRAVLRLAFEAFPPAYRQFHADLLFHQSDRELWRPLLVGRVCEAILAVGGPWDESQRIVAAAIARLNDYVGHRPVAVLRTTQRIEPYAHEWIRPVPLYVPRDRRRRGAIPGHRQPALAILNATAPAILADAYFDPELLDELAFDPRAYDFDHPVNKRPNYHFGQWDPHHIDNRGRYRRFVLQQVTLDTLLAASSKPTGRFARSCSSRPPPCWPARC